MQNTSVSLNDELDVIVKEVWDSGKFKSIYDIVRKINNKWLSRNSERFQDKSEMFEKMLNETKEK